MDLTIDLPSGQTQALAEFWVLIVIGVMQRFPGETGQMTLSAPGVDWGAIKTTLDAMAGSLPAPYPYRCAIDGFKDPVVITIQHLTPEQIEGSQI